MRGPGLQVGIIGGGMIGAGWARLLRAHGHQVRLYDERPDRQDGAASIAEAAAGADLVIEAVAERAEVKRAVLGEVDRNAPPDALIASSSSSILPTWLQEGVAHPERVLVLHPLHPVELMPVIEVVPGHQTSPQAVERGRALVLALGKLPVVLKREVPGYVVNRLAAALWREAIDLVLTGVVGPEELDLAASRGPCLGWAVQGPFLTYQLAAPEGFGAFMAHLHPAFQAIWSSLAGWKAVPEGELERLAARVEATYGAMDRGQLEQARDIALRRILQ